MIFKEQSYEDNLLLELIEDDKEALLAAREDIVIDEPNNYLIYDKQTREYINNNIFNR